MNNKKGRRETSGPFSLLSSESLQLLEKVRHFLSGLLRVVHGHLHAFFSDLVHFHGALFRALHGVVRHLVGYTSRSRPNPQTIASQVLKTFVTECLHSANLLHSRSPFCALSTSFIGSLSHPAGDRPSHPIWYGTCPATLGLAGTFTAHAMELGPHSAQNLAMQDSGPKSVAGRS
jgi:hypothetical protein